jgi:hypothetical protein
MNRSHVLPLIALACFAATGLVAQSSSNTTVASSTTDSLQLEGQVIVYRLAFAQTGDSINYRPYQGGFYVAPLSGGVGTLILTLQTGSKKQYFTYASFGSVFAATSGKKKRMVLSATTTNDISTTTFFAIGELNDTLKSDNRNISAEVSIAKTMKGYAVSADNEKDLVFTGTGNAVGVAGASTLTATLDESLTNLALDKNQTVALEVTNLQNILKKGGYTDGKVSTTTGTGANATTTTVLPP